MKKICFCIFVLMFCLVWCANALAADTGVEIYVNEVKLDCAVKPFIRDGRTMVPMRVIFEALGANVEWEDNTRTITATKSEDVVVLQIDNPVLHKNGQAVELDVAPILSQSTTFVPVRAVSQSLDARVEWTNFNQTVYVNSANTYLRLLHEEVQRFMKASMPAEYSKYGYAMVQGYVQDVVISEDIVFLLIRDFYDSAVVEAVCVAETEQTDFNKLKEYFKDTYISAGGRILGKTKALNDAETISLEYVKVFETEAELSAESLRLPQVQKLGEKVVMYKGYGNSVMIDATNVEKYKKQGWSLEPWQLLYHTDGKIMQVEAEQVHLYLQEGGWYKEPPVHIYTADGRDMYVLESEVATYAEQGWSVVPPDLFTIYHIDGKTKKVPEYEVMDYLNTKEWFMEPPVKLYDKKGKYKYVVQSEVADYLNAGWTMVPESVTVYNTDGSTRVVYKHNADDYLRTGVWFTEPPVLMYNADGETKYIVESEVDDYIENGWSLTPPAETVILKGYPVYITPYGKKWHFDKECAGKNGTPVELEYARSKGYTRCHTCS